MKDYVKIGLLFWMVVCTSVSGIVQPSALPVSLPSNRYSSCVQSQTHGHVIVQADVIECEIQASSSSPIPSSSASPSSSIQPSSSTETSTSSSTSSSSSTTSSTTASSTSTSSSSLTSTYLPSTTPVDFTCSAGEICCETRTIGNVVVIAEVLQDVTGNASCTESVPV